MCYKVKMPRKERLSRTKVDEVAECFRGVTNVLKTHNHACLAIIIVF